MSFPNYALHSKPVNSTAGRVAFGDGQGYEPKRKPAIAETWDAPPLPLSKRPDAAPDVTGQRRGYMTAFRYYHSGSSGSKWVCRCDCGRYELRNSKRWLEKKHLPDACLVCCATFYATHGHSLGDERSEKDRKDGKKVESK